MKARAIFVTFFLIFALASIAVPMFPGNMIHRWFRIPLSAYTPYIEAVTNGLVYGFITWMVFFMISKRMDKALPQDSTRARTTLNPSTEGKKTPEKDLSKQDILETAPTKRRGKPTPSNKTQDEPVETPEREEPAKVSPPLPIKTKKTGISEEARNSGCPYHFGYLRECPKKTQIPNECLTCTTLVECLSRVE